MARHATHRATAMLAASLAAAAVSHACRYPATEVVVSLASDVPVSRALTVRVVVRDGLALVGDGGALDWTRDGGATAASFGVVPGPDAPRDARVTLVIEAEVGPGAGDPPRRWRRIARFRFTPRMTTQLPIFLPVACGELASGCLRSAPEACTVSAYCEEQGQTCGDEGRCTTVEVAPRVDGGGVSPAIDAAPPAVTDAPPDVGPPPPPVDMGPPATDASDDAPPADAGPPPLPPRPLAPLSTALNSSQRPLFRWRLASGTDGAVLELCRTRACTSVVHTFEAVGGVFAGLTPIAPGVWFWRLRGRAGARIGPPSNVVWQFTAPRRNPPTSKSWGTITDVNGDGLADVVAGAFAARSVTGAVTVHPGSASGASVMPAQTIPGRYGAQGRFGVSVASAGDVNGDGYGDVIVGEPVDGSAAAGTAYVYHGGATGLAATPAATIRSPDPDVQARFGAAVGFAGDLNEDGYADVVVGAPGARGGVGRAWVLYGSPTGVTTTGAVAYDNPTADGGFGLSVGSAGDVNADGHDELLIAAANDNALYVYAGTGSGTGARTTLRPATFSEFGWTVGGPGDVNGDGFPDLVVGGPEFQYPSHVGRAFVYHSSAAGLNTTPAATLAGSGAANAYFGNAVATTDLDGDGFDDVVVGAPGEGQARAFRGSAAGVSATAAATVSSGTAGDELGRAAARGDYNGDGLDDVAIGAERYNGFDGAVFVYGGASTGALLAPSRVTLLRAPAACCGAGQFGHDIAWRVRALPPRARRPAG